MNFFQQSFVYLFFITCFLLVFSSRNKAEIQQKITTPNQHLKEIGWSRWQPWDNFPHDRIQMGMSNMDYGGLMDTEYICFGSVGSENDEKKSQTYWYRIAEKTELIANDTIVQIEVGCWIDNQFKAKMPVNGIIFLEK